MNDKTVTETQIESQVHDATVRVLRKILSEELKYYEADILLDTPFENYGVESIMAVQLTNRLTTEFGRLPSTLFFENQNLNELADYFIENHASDVEIYLLKKDALEVTETPATATENLVADNSKNLFDSKNANLSKDTVAGLLKKILSEELSCAENNILLDTPFEDYGIESKLVIRLNDRLAEEFGRLPSTLFFECQNLSELTDYFLEEHAATLGIILDKNIATPTSSLDLDHHTSEDESPTGANSDSSQHEEFNDEVVQYLIKILSEEIGFPEENISVDSPFEDYGIESILIVRLNNRLTEEFGRLPSTLFFEYQNLKELAEYFIEEHFSTLENILSKVFIDGSSSTSVINAIAADADSIQEANNSSYSHDINRPADKAVEIINDGNRQSSPLKPEDIAIIGVAGKYPDANTIEDFWENLKQGRDSVTEIPAERWDMDEFYNEDRDNVGTSYSKWGGFINDVDKFDPLFFNISPSSAELMDPQERLFVETAWETLEDAGYTRNELQKLKTKGGLGGNVGVFVGIMYEEYHLLAIDERHNNNFVAPWGVAGFSANRVSHLLNFHGPSMVVDTMCSSSLVAVHLACQAILNNDCEVALAGGSNVTIHPNKYLVLSESNAVSSRGKSSSFGADGDGYVPAEGVGAVFLKSLSKAEADGDQIYGVIKGTSINHGGKTNGFTVPNPKAQADLIKIAMDRAGIEAEDFSYIEAHGTGTSLGDPIEIAGLNRAFATTKKQYCRIGSVKSNIGHCESAAGISGLTKLILQLKHKQLVPSLHSATLNPNIDFENSPFIVQQELEDWIVADGKTRIAGISGFGAGGSNAHVVVEEYCGKHENYKSDMPVIIILSARNENRLKLYASKLEKYLTTKNDINLYDVSYTLQMGREEMNERLAFVAQTKGEAITALKNYQLGKLDALFQNNIKTNGNLSQGNINRITLENGNFSTLAEQWINGSIVDWASLYPDNNYPKKISLPTYPFERERYWLSDERNTTAVTSKSQSSKHQLTQLLHFNSSKLHEQKFSSHYSGSEYFFEECEIFGEKVLPHMAHISIALSAGYFSLEEKITQIKNVKWLNILESNSDHKNLHISLFQDSDEVVYEIYSGESDTEVLHAQGELTTRSLAPIDDLDISSTREGLLNRKSNRELYSLFEKKGLHYGESFQRISEIYYNESEVLSEIKSLKSSDDRSQLSLLDTVVQTCVSYFLNLESTDLCFPSHAKSINIYDDITQASWCHLVRHASNQELYEICLLSNSGKVIVKFNEVAPVTYEQQKSKTSITSSEVSNRLLLFKPEWNPSALNVVPKSIETVQLIVFMGTVTESFYQSIGKKEQKDVFWIPATDALNAIAELYDILRVHRHKDGRHHIVVVHDNSDWGHYNFISGLFKTFQLSDPKLSGQLLGVDIENLDDTKLLEILAAERAHKDIEIRYKFDKRESRKLSVYESTQSPSQAIEIKAHGVYIITGGAGGIGLAIAKHISTVKEITVILLGRREINESIRENIKPIRNAYYFSCDVTNKDSLRIVINQVRDRYKKIDGIVHAAGTVGTGEHSVFDLDNIAESAVLTPKILGSQYLDELTASDRLDFMIGFSSISGTIDGVIGLDQSDYAVASAYLNQFAYQRNHAVELGQRHGQTISINWTLWQVGMYSDELNQWLDEVWGFKSLPVSEGVKAFDQILENPSDQLVALYGEAKRLRQITTHKQSVDGVYMEDNKDELVASVQKQLVEIVSKTIKIEIDRIDITEEWGVYGFDSISLNKLSINLTEHYGLELLPTTFFNYLNIEKLSQFLVEEYSNEMTEMHGKKPVKPKIATTANSKIPIEAGPTAASSIRTKYKHRTPQLETAASVNTSEPIAIIGMNCRFPGSPDLNRFWENLENNSDMITEVPPERWDWREHYGDNVLDKFKTKIKWGGFIEDADKFDPLHFNISPREAELMDPQHRISIESVYHALEDAGINPKRLSGTNTGIFIGCYFDDYSKLIDRNGLSAEAQTATGLFQSMVANRISYLLDINGPSETVNTACSSSLIAIHRGIEKIRSGDCDIVIAGGVSLNLIPDTLFLLNQAGMASEDGRCKSFDAAADGYARGEGVGMVVLKSLAKAKKDGDQIHAVIRSSSENHGGKANTLTSPNPNAQKELLIKAYQSANINPNDVSYIEAHGTGTPLGDPIETEGLKSAFQTLYKERDLNIPAIPHIKLGTVKANIGHLEPAAGIAGVLKVVQSLKHKVLPGNPQLKTPNSYLKLDNTPFALQQETTAWDCEIGKTRIAGVSSFGYGGVNAHVVLEEYAQAMTNYTSDSDAIIVLSARTDMHLKDHAQRLSQYLENREDINIHDLAYTLQTGREDMNSRLAFLTSSPEQVIAQLKAYVLDQAGEFFVANRQNEKNRFMLDGKSGQGYIDLAIQNKELKSLAQLWTSGASLDWTLLYEGGNSPNKISLPGYPFARKRYWYDSCLPNRETIAQLPEKKNLADTKNRRSSDGGFWESVLDEELSNHIVTDEVRVNLIDNNIAVVRLNCPSNRNMFDENLIRSLHKTFFDLRKNRHLKVVVLTGYDDVFCMGGTKETLESIAKRETRFSSRPFVYRGLLEFDVPVVSAIQGHAFGGGLLFGLYADIVVMSEKSTYSANFMKYGFTPGMGSTFILGEKLGNPLAAEMMYRAKLISGKEIKERGASITITEDVFKEAIHIARELALKPRKSLELLKKKLSQPILSQLQEHIDEEEVMHDKTLQNEEVKNLIQKHFEKSSLSTEPPKATNKINLNSQSHRVPKLPDDKQDKDQNLIVLEALSSMKEDKDYSVKEDNSIFSIDTNKKGPSSQLDKAPPVKQLRKIFEEILHISGSEINAQTSFTDLGVDSINGVEIIRRINDVFSLSLEAVTLYDYFTLDTLSSLIDQEVGGLEAHLADGVDDGNLSALTSVEFGSVNSMSNDQKQLFAGGSAQVIHKLRDIFEGILHLDASEFDENSSFINLGVDSINGVEIVRSINEYFSLSLEAIILYDYHSLNELSNLIVKEINLLETRLTDPISTSNDTSIVLENSDNMPKPQLVETNNTFEKIKLEPREISNSKVAAETLDKKPIPQQTSNIEVGNKTSNEHSDTQKPGLIDVAIVGMSGRFPDADNVDIFWDNLKQGKNSIKDIPVRKWDVTEDYSVDKTKAGKSYSDKLCCLDDEDKFDAEFFNIAPREAEKMDPQQRIFLEECWKAIEDSACDPSTLAGEKCGVFVGVSHGDYDFSLSDEERDSHVLTGMRSSILAARISYHLDLQGPAIAIETSCSSSLVAIHQAYQSIQLGDSDMALAGGVYLTTTKDSHVLASKSNMLSEKGRCSTFDQDADGFVLGEAVGVVMLKPLDKAIEESDQIYAVIKGSGINQDGRTNGITAPSFESQARLEMDVYNRANINPETISYIEAHGTGTKLGDPVEVKALKMSFAKTSKKYYCGLGSVKANIGHTLSAAGVCGLIKLLLQLKNKQLVPAANFNQLNEHIELSDSPFYISTELNDWTTGFDQPRRSAVSSFGFSGTNAHMVLEEYIQPKTNYTSDEPTLILLSAKSETSLFAQVKNLYNYLNTNSVNISLYDVAYTLQTGRQSMDVRLALIVSDIKTLLEQMESFLSGDTSKFLMHDIKLDRNGFRLKGKSAEGYIKTVMESKEIDSLAQLWLHGITIDWNLWYATNNLPRKISLPTYPFERKKHWIANKTTFQQSTSIEKTLGDQSPIEIELSDKNNGAALSTNEKEPKSNFTNEKRHLKTKENVEAGISIEKVQNKLIHILKTALYLDGPIDLEKAFVDLGMDSIVGVEFIGSLNTEFKLTLEASKIYDYPTSASLSKYIFNLLPKNSDSVGSTDINVEKEEYKDTSQHEPISLQINDSYNVETEIDDTVNIETSIPDSEETSTAIAIVGLSGRYPKSENISQFWENISSGTSCISEVKERWDIQDHYEKQGESAGKVYCKWLGQLDDIESFDASFFNINPIEAETMDPQYRILLQECWRALEDGGFSKESLNGVKCGTYIGIESKREYAHLAAISDVKGTPQIMTGNSNAIAAARLSYLLDLKGPAIAIDTACSSSLVAIHLSCQALLSNEIDMAVSGGVCLYLGVEAYYSMCAAGMLSPTGQCRTFDESADGFVPGEAAGVVILKRLKDAELNGDNIIGIIKCSGINQDGATNGITAPSVISQIDLVKDLYDRFNINPSEISYVEAHGTGTSLGDPIEVEALNKSFRLKTSEKNYCGLGSVKSNTGHTSAAAGIAGITKVLLQMKHKKIAPTINFQQLNEQINLTDSPFYINTSLKYWETKDNQNRMAAVSSFGFSGTNAHVVLEEYNGTTESYKGTGPAAILLSAKNAKCLKLQIEQLKNYLSANTDANLYDLAYTLQIGRDAMASRLALVVESIEDLTSKLMGYLTSLDFAKNENSVSINDSNQFDIDDAIKDRNYDLLVDLWMNHSYSIPWRKLYENAPRPKKINLPTYPFEKSKYWFNSYSLSVETKTIDNKKMNIGKEKSTERNLSEQSFWELGQSDSLLIHQIGEEVQFKLMDDGVGIIQLNSPSTNNMLDTTMCNSLHKTFLYIRKINQLKVIIITGHGNVYCMGGTQAGLQNIANGESSFTDVPFLYRGLLEFDVPVISAIQGHAFGGGLMFGLYADIVIMNEESTYTANFMKYGFTPGLGATYILGEKLGKQLATEMMYTARLMSGKEIKSRGASVIITSDVLKEALRIARELSNKPRESLEILKKSMSKRILPNLLEIIDEEEEMHEKTFHSDSVKNNIDKHFTKSTSNPGVITENKINDFTSKIQLSNPSDLELEGTR